MEGGHNYMDVETFKESYDVETGETKIICITTDGEEIERVKQPGFWG